MNMEYQVVSTQGSYAATATYTTAPTWSAHLVTFWVASGGGSGPGISSLSPTSGVIGTSVTINGTNFGATQGSNTLTFNGTTASSISGWGDTAIHATLPAGATTGNVVVTVGGVASNGVLFTVNNSGSTIFYYFGDSLGTARVITDSAGTVCYDADFYPYGGERTPYTNNCSTTNNYKFTGKERDSESNLDNFGFRNYGSSLARFSSPDRYNAVLTKQNLEAGGLPAGAASGFLDGYISNPQNWNQYAYVWNNPLNFVDPTGAAAIPDGHHLFSDRGGLGPIARNFTNAIKTGELSGNGAPNQPGFNRQHIEYNEAVEDLLEDIEKTAGDRDDWSIAQWKDAAYRVLNSTNPAIKDFLDDLDANNPGARAALATAISTYRLTAAATARVVAALLVDTLSRFTDLIIVVDPARMPSLIRPNDEGGRKSSRDNCLRRRDGTCVD
jgi:RHS repeat-associated protein